MSKRNKSKKRASNKPRDREMNKRNEDLCKVFVKFPVAGKPGTESIWALRVSPTTARIDNVPFFTAAVGLGDLVRVGDSGEVVEVLERATRTRCSSYQPDVARGASARQWQEVKRHLGVRGIECESAAPGVFSLSVPLDVSDDALVELAATCPVSLARPAEPSEEQIRLLARRSRS